MKDIFDIKIYTKEELEELILGYNDKLDRLRKGIDNILEEIRGFQEKELYHLMSDCTKRLSEFGEEYRRVSYEKELKEMELEERFTKL